MKSSILRTGLALACAVSLASCGGGNTGTLYLAGSFEGVTVDGLILQNNGGADLAIPGVASGKGTFQFKDLVPSDSIYNVAVKKTNGVENRPSNTDSCTVTFGSGNTGLYSVNSVYVKCVIRTHGLSGNVSGLGTDSVVLINGVNQVAVTGTGANSVPFTMAPVSEGYPYGITVLTQPAGKTCTVTNGVGTLGTADVGNVTVACLANAGT
ncbi:MAG: hypothetical protein EOP02_37215 [Proteobacteria bacterium]|nr:MAG: hypothetical protein EOP02_37215 [Pseudomonadota bacterium]